MKRTHTCGELNATNIGEPVTLQGWVENRRDHGGLLFIDLRDRYGITQLVFDPEKNETIFACGKEVRPEFVIEIEGEVIGRPKGMINKQLLTGEIEIGVQKCTILNHSKTPPFLIIDDVDANEETRLRYRYLDLRRPELQKSLLLRHRLAQTMRRFLNDQGFLEIETPFLMRSTPEGARDFLVPSRIHKGKFYALPQSPQIYKQTLMISGFDKYFQIVKCFRDEDLRADRQPEFTQVDIEMSFVDESDVIDVVERLMVEVFKNVLNKTIHTPFPRMTFHEAMASYGSDKPDLRFGMPIIDVSACVESGDFKIFIDTIKNGGMVGAINLKECAHYSRKQIDEINQYIISLGGRGVMAVKITTDGWDSSIKKFLNESAIENINVKLGAITGDIIFIIADIKENVQKYLGELRLKLAHNEKLIRPDDFRQVWITDFPLLEFDKNEQRYIAMHHPFTSPKEEDFHLLSDSPQNVRARAYDLVLNGNEIAGGSIRNHLFENQSKIFSLLDISPEQAQQKFGFLLEALQYGAPPHGGIAFGFDRLAMILAQKNSIRDVIAFPKTTAAYSLMDESPSAVSKEQLKDLGLMIEIT